MYMRTKTYWKAPLIIQIGEAYKGSLYASIHQQQFPEAQATIANLYVLTKEVYGEQVNVFFDAETTATQTRQNAFIQLH